MVVRFIAFSIFAQALFGAIPIVMTMPHSGTTLSLYTLSVLTGKPVKYLEGKKTLPVHYAVRQSGYTYISAHPCVYRSHEPDRIRKYEYLHAPLLFVIRNHRELVLREKQVGYLGDLPSKQTQAYIDRFVTCLRLYDKWRFRKAHFYYEDLIGMSQKDELTRLVSFVGGQVRDFASFWDKREKNFRILRNIYLIKYKKGEAGESSKERPKKCHYSEGVAEDILRAIDHEFIKRDPHLFEKYLKRYT